MKKRTNLTRDNKVYPRKVALRRLALDLLQHPERYQVETEDASRFALIDVDQVTEVTTEPTVEPIVMETHGGFGRIFLECYRNIRHGIVFEVDGPKADALAEQRPTWAVYQTNCEMAIRAGAGAHLAVNLLDIDPYGEPWPVIEAFFASERPRPERMVVVVNDGLRRNVRFGFSWSTKSLEQIVEKYGNDLFNRYLEICQELMENKAAQAGYRLDRFAGYYCGDKDQITHYVAALIRVPISASPV